jgi:hypothetical protein
MGHEPRTTLSKAVAVLAAVLAANVNAASVATVPIRLFGTEAPVIIVRVQGKELPLQLDLGDASSLVIHPEILSSLRSVPTGKTLKFFGMDGEFETPIVSLESVEIGALTFRSVEARRDTHDEAFLNAKKAGVGAVGFIGTGLFNSGQIRLDYSRRKLTISLPEKAEEARNLCRGKAVPFVLNKYGFTTSVGTDIGELQLGWDTGAPAILISRSAAGVAQIPMDQESAVSKKFVIAGEDFGPQRIEIWDNMPLPPEIAGLVGHPFFQKHIVCFDYPAQQLHIR